MADSEVLVGIITASVALIGIGGTAAVGLVLHHWSRQERREEALRSERQTRYAELLEVSEPLIIELHGMWTSLQNDITAVKLAEDRLAEADSAEAEQYWVEDRDKAMGRLGDAVAAAVDREALLAQARTVRLRRIQVQLVGSPPVADLALRLSERLFDAVGELADPEDATKAVEALLDIRGIRMELQDEAVHDVQLKRLQRKIPGRDRVQVIGREPDE
jgi:hypothetical protein